MPNPQTTLKRQLILRAAEQIKMHAGQPLVGPERDTLRTLTTLLYLVLTNHQAQALYEAHPWLKPDADPKTFVLSGQINELLDRLYPEPQQLLLFQESKPA